MEVKAATMRDRVNVADKKDKQYEEAISDYVKRLFLKKHSGLL